MARSPGEHSNRLHPASHSGHSLKPVTPPTEHALTVCRCYRIFYKLFPRIYPTSAGFLPLSSVQRLFSRQETVGIGVYIAFIGLIIGLASIMVDIFYFSLFPSAGNSMFFWLIPEYLFYRVCFSGYGNGFSPMKGGVQIIRSLVLSGFPRYRLKKWIRGKVIQELLVLTVIQLFMRPLTGKDRLRTTRLTTKSTLPTRRNGIAGEYRRQRESKDRLCRYPAIFRYRSLR